jgi:hypothetical protein
VGWLERWDERNQEAVDEMARATRSPSRKVDYIFVYGLLFLATMSVCGGIVFVMSLTSSLDPVPKVLAAVGAGVFCVLMA